MNHTITHLKAPWPEGAKVGDVVKFPEGRVPAWAVGKCQEAGEGVKPTLKFEPKAEPVGTSQDLEELRQQAQAFIDDLKAKHAEEVKRLRADIDAGGQALQAALADAKTSADALTAAQAEVADLKAKLETATKTGKK